MKSTYEKSRLLTWRDAVLSDDNDLTPMQRHVAAALAKHMNSEGGSCRPSIATLVAETGTEKKGRTVTKALDRLVCKGWIRRHRSKGGRRANRYEACFPWECDPVEIDPHSASEYTPMPAPNTPPFEDTGCGGSTPTQCGGSPLTEWGTRTPLGTPMKDAPTKFVTESQHAARTRERSEHETEIEMEGNPREEEVDLRDTGSRSDLGLRQRQRRELFRTRVEHGRTMQDVDDALREATGDPGVYVRRLDERERMQLGLRFDLTRSLTSHELARAVRLLGESS